MSCRIDIRCKRNGATLIISTLFMAFTCLTVAYEQDQPCAARPIANRSVVCVCNETYCDTIYRAVPQYGEYVTYVSTESGDRFNKTFSRLRPYEIPPMSSTILNLYPTITYQAIKGFGGAVTDSTAIVWDSLGNDTLKRSLIDSYASDSGIQYTMLRVPIGGTDFSTRAYAYNELPEGDTELANFTLAPEDYNYRIPMIQALMEASSTNISMIGSVWSPPKWMKDNNAFYGVSYLKEEYYQTLADYHVKFLEEYEKQGIPFWGVTTGNEPLTSITGLGEINCLGWTLGGMASWIVDYIGPTLKCYNSNLKLLGVDDQRFAIPIWFNEVLFKKPEVAKVLDGIAVHFYFDNIVPPAQLTLPLVDYPNLFVISTEASIGVLNDMKVDLGSWERAEQYANDIIEDLNYNVTGWIDWNMCLNDEGGPTWAKNYLDSPIIVSADEDVFYKQPMFYAIGHFSKFLPVGSLRILSEDSSSSLNHVAFLTPDNTIVVIFLNRENKEIDVTINLGNNQATVVLEPKSITTVELSCDDLWN